MLRLSDEWEIRGVIYKRSPSECIQLSIRETPKFWTRVYCPQGHRKLGGIRCQTHAEPRSWRHLDAFGKRGEIVCALPRASCIECGLVWTVTPPWEGRHKYFTKDFEDFVLMLMKDMPVQRVIELIGETEVQLGSFRQMQAVDS